MFEARVNARHVLTRMQVDYAHAEQDESIEANAGNLGSSMLPFRNRTACRNIVVSCCTADLTCSDTPQ